MLILRRREGESVQVGDDVTVTVLEKLRHGEGNIVQLGITAPPCTDIRRTELDAIEPTPEMMQRRALFKLIRTMDPAEVRALFRFAQDRGLGSAA